MPSAARPGHNGCVDFAPSSRTDSITLKRAYADGTVAVVMAPLSLLCRLAMSVPPPRYHTVKYAGVLASASPCAPASRPLLANGRNAHRVRQARAPTAIALRSDHGVPTAPSPRKKMLSSRVSHCVSVENQVLRDIARTSHRSGSKEPVEMQQLSQVGGNHPHGSVVSQGK